MKRKIEEQKPVEPPMTPMIDVIFQLLIFFMLTLKIKAEEGKLLNRLPKDKGQAAASVPSPETQEVRVFLCCVDEADPQFEKRVRRHMNNKGRHEAELEKMEQKDLGDTGGGGHAPHIVINDVCTAFVDNEKTPMGRLYQTWVCPKGHREEKSLGGGKRAEENQKRYREIAVKVKDLYDRTPASRDPKKKAPVIVDTDSATPYEHIVGIVNALKEVGIENVEFVANSRHSKYYAARTGGQFDTYREQVK